MNNISLSPTVKTVIDAVTALRNGISSDLQDVKDKINKYVTANPNAIPVKQQTEIQTLLGRLSDVSAKTTCCDKILALINAAATVIKPVAVVIQPTATKEAAAKHEFDEKKLEEAKKLLLQAFGQDSHITSTSTVQLFGQFRELTTQHERMIILIEIIKNHAKHDEKKINTLLFSLFYDIDKFGIQYESYRCILAKLACDVNKAYYVLANIERLKISEVKMRVEIAKSAASSLKNSSVAKYIPNFEISNELDRVEIAKIEAASTNVDFSFASDFKKYGITQENARFEVAAISARKKNLYASTIASQIQNFQLSELHRIEIAKILLVTNPNDLCWHFDKFSITQERLRFEFAAAITALKVSRTVTENYSKFNLSMSHRNALMDAQRTPSEFCKKIDSYNLTENERIAMAKVTAHNQTDQDHLSEHLPKFNITKKEERLEILRLLLSKYFNQVCKFIGCFDVTEADRFEIAKEIALSTNFSNLNKLTDSIELFDLSYEHRLSIAQQMASTYSAVTALTSSNFNKFQLTDGDKRTLAYQIANQHSEYVIRNCVMHFGLSEADRLAIAKIGASKDTPSCFFNLSDYKLQKAEDRAAVFMAGLSCNFDDANRSIDSYSVRYILPDVPKWLEGLNKTASSSNNEDVKRWWTSFKVLMPLLTENEWKEYLPYLEQILQFENPAVRLLLTTALIKYRVSTIPPKQGKNPSLINIVLAPLLTKINLIDAEKVWEIFGSSEYREASSSKIERVIKGLYCLIECEELNPQEKRVLIYDIFNQHAKLPVDSALQMYAAIANSKNIAMLKNIEQIQKASTANVSLKQSLDLKETMKDIFKATIGLGSINNFGQKYMATIGSHTTRNPTALHVYAANLAGLQQMEAEETLKSLRIFVESVLEGTYKQMRYQALPNSHLFQVFAGREQLQQEWQKGAVKTVKALHEESEKTIVSTKESDSKHKVEKSFTPSFDTVGFLHDIICRSKHLGRDPEAYKFINNCLTDPSQGKKQLELCKNAEHEAKKALEAKGFSIKDAYDPKNELTASFHQRRFECSLITLSKLKTNTERLKQVQTILKKITDNKLAGMCPAQFLDDMMTLQKHLTAENTSMPDKEVRYDQFEVQDTDEWEDMELCGTEVVGSCQRIGGSVEFNKCLLAYMKDGKNRAIVIKDPATGKIVARRIMRILLDKKTKCPVLFKEKLYYNPGIPKRALDAMDMLFINRARMLKIPLVKQMDEGILKTFASTNTHYPNELESLGSSAPYEYVDAADLGITDGSFIIPAEKIEAVFQP